MAISTADFKTGLTIEFEGKVYQILEFQHVKPGKGGAFVRSRLRNLQTGSTLERTWRAGESMEQALVERRNVEFLYRDGEDFHFMDMEDFEQLSLTAAQGQYACYARHMERQRSRSRNPTDNGVQNRSDRSRSAR
jgi:elongation factor P